MLCKWSHGTDVFEFDAESKVEEIQKVREFAKGCGWKFRDMKKEKE